MTGDVQGVDLAAVAELLDLAADGPWHQDGPFWWPGPDEFAEASTMITAGEDREPVCVMPRRQDRRGFRDQAGGAMADARLIAAAPTLLADLAAEVTRLRAELARPNPATTLDRMEKEIRTLRRERDEARAQLSDPWSQG